ncbi:histidine triad nucleotide-binding protein [bacterium]
MSSTRHDCIFCKIVNKEIPAQLLYEDDNIIAFNDIDPKAPIHILIIPKKHIQKVSEVNIDDKDLLSSMIFIANKLAKEKSIDESGFRLVLNCGSDGGQAVDHVHLHLFGGRPMNWPPG